MTAKEIIRRFRILSNDKVEPYFWQDDELLDWLNDAQREAAIRGRLISEHHNLELTSINVVAGNPVCRLHSLMYEIDSAMFSSGGNSECIRLLSVEEMDRIDKDWRTASGRPLYALQDDTRIILSPAPDMDGVLYVGGYRLPMKIETLDDFPEINEIHHVKLIQWMLYQAFSIPDVEGFDPNRSQLALAAFEEYFGIRVDSDLRRTTREDISHHIRPYWV